MDKEGSNINKKYPPRISNRVINHKYIAYTFDVLVKGTILPFDCYIKRYNDFVIIIEAGTFMSEELLEKLHNNKYIYFLKSNFEKINQYQLEHEIVSLTDTALDALGTSEEQL
ncbi:MAG: hypothetical protein PHV62_06805, partial [Sulfuricurvum sp.]|nr:hypothetical protein [Sulfuricurvum sp.]